MKENLPSSSDTSRHGLGFVANEEKRFSRSADLLEKGGTTVSVISRFTLREKESVVVIVFVENVTTLFSYTHKSGADKVINFVHANSAPCRERAREHTSTY